MDYSSLKLGPQGVVISGSWTRILVAPLSWFLTRPPRDTQHKHQISADFVFKTGKSWIEFYSTQKTTNLDEKGSEVPDNDASTSVFKCKVAGFDEIRRQFVTNHQKDQMIVVIQKCGDVYPRVMGDSCSSANMMWAYAEGNNVGDESAVEFTFTREGAFPIAIYKGTLNGNNVFAADDATPSVSDGTVFFTSGSHTDDLDITDLDDAVVGAKYMIIGGDGTFPTTIANAGKFSLTAGWTGAVGTFIEIFCRGNDDFVELNRG